MKTLLLSTLLLTMVAFMNGSGTFTPFHSNGMTIQSQDDGGQEPAPEPEPTPEPEQ